MSPLLTLTFFLLALDVAYGAPDPPTRNMRLANFLSRYHKRYYRPSGQRPCDFKVYHGYRKCCLKYPDDPCTCNGIVAICAEAMAPPEQDTCRVLPKNGGMCCRKRPGEYCMCPADVHNLC